MSITLFRIDDRLIHGQIATAWRHHADAEQIMVIDDLAASDKMQQQLLKLATPKEVELVIASLEDGKQLVKEDNDKNTLVLVRGVSQAQYILENNNDIELVNVGNLNMKSDKERILDNFWVNKEDIDAFIALDEMGKKLEYRTVPSDRPQNVLDLLKKENYV